LAVLCGLERIQIEFVELELRQETPEEINMPHYVFRCDACRKEFTEILHISELETAKVKCPHCGSNKVVQQVAEFAAMTSKKS
jgi:putative FmdB family regulatory protein